MNEKSVVANNLWDFLVEVQKLVLDGYKLSEFNQHFPQAYVGMYTCGMVKDISKEETNVANQETLRKVSTEPSVEISEQEVTQGITFENKATTAPVKATGKRGRK